MPGTTSESKDEVSYTVGLPRIAMIEVRDRIAEVVEKAMSGEPQVLTRYSRDTVVVIGVKEYERLRALEPSAA